MPSAGRLMSEYVFLYFLGQCFVDHSVEPEYTDKIINDHYFQASQATVKPTLYTLQPAKIKIRLY